MSLSPKINAALFLSSVYCFSVHACVSVLTAAFLSVSLVLASFVTLLPPTVRYLASLRAFVSCCTRPQSSMVIGWRDEDGGKMRVTTYVTQRGVRDIDYLCERNLIGRQNSQIKSYCLLCRYEDKKKMFNLDISLINWFMFYLKVLLMFILVP